MKVVGVAADAVVMTGLNRNCPTCLYHYTPTLTLIKVTDAQGNPADSTNLGFLPLGPDWAAVPGALPRLNLHPV